MEHQCYRRVGTWIGSIRGLRWVGSQKLFTLGGMNWTLSIVQNVIKVPTLAYNWYISATWLLLCLQTSDNFLQFVVKQVKELIAQFRNHGSDRVGLWDTNFWRIGRIKHFGPIPISVLLVSRCCWPLDHSDTKHYLYTRSTLANGRAAFVRSPLYWSGYSNPLP